MRSIVSIRVPSRSNKTQAMPGKGFLRSSGFRSSTICYDKRQTCRLQVCRKIEKRKWRMAKIIKDISGALFPTPVVLVTTVDPDGKPNIITLAWVGIVSSSPFTLSVAIRPSRYSHGLLGAVPELAVNVPTKEIVASTDYCGTVSGRTVDKFAGCGLTPVPADEIKAPLIKECPINLECRVTNTLSLGTHDVFISEVIKVHIDEELVDESGRVDYGRLAPFVYLGMDYWTLAEKIGHYGYSKKG